MKKVSLEQTQEFKNSDLCIATEYDFGDKDIDIATAVINGRYPEDCYCVNTEVKEMIYVISGEGKIHKENDHTVSSEVIFFFIITPKELFNVGNISLSTIVSLIFQLLHSHSQSPQLSYRRALVPRSLRLWFHPEKLPCP